MSDFAAVSPSSNTTPALRGLLVSPIARHVAHWLAEGKIEDEMLERELSDDARALLDHSVANLEWVPLSDGEALLRVATDQLGADAALAEWADEIVDGWLAEDAVRERVDGAGRLVDGSGFAVSQTSELLVEGCRWSYEGDGDKFRVTLDYVEALTPSMRSLLGACLAKLAQVVGARPLDVRFEGVDDDALVIFGEVEASDRSDAESRLHRAALVA